MRGSEWRKQFGPADSMCRAGTAQCRVEQVRKRMMNFSQHWRTPGIQDVDYEALVPGPFVRSMLDEWLAEYRADAERSPDPTDEMEQTLREQLWPDATAILAAPALASLVLEYYGPWILEEWFDAGPVPGVEQFVLNTIDRTEVRNGSPVFSGKARMPDEDVKYQDW